MSERKICPNCGASALHGQELDHFMACEPTDQEQVVSILQNLKSTMQTSSIVLSRQGPKLQQCAKELNGAADMVQDWLEGVVEEGANS